MDTTTDLPREGRLIEQAREHLSIPQNEAARRAGMSGTRWRQIVERDAPTMRSKRGVERLALMAQVVGNTSEQFAEIDRADVAEKLRTRRPPRAPTNEELAEVTARLAAKNEQLEARNEQIEADLSEVKEQLRRYLGHHDNERRDAR